MSKELIAYFISLIIMSGTAYIGLEAARLFSKLSRVLSVLILVLLVYILYTAYDIFRDILNPTLVESEKRLQILGVMLTIFPLMLGIGMWLGVKLHLTYGLTQMKMVGYALVACVVIGILFVSMLPYLGIHLGTI